jgi:hypothetical protein
LRFAFVFCNFFLSDLRFAGRLAGAVAAQRTAVGMSQGWNYQCIQEEYSCRNDK